MKKIFTLLLSLAFVSAYAQITVSPTGMMDEIGMEAEGMSPDMHFVAGLNQLSTQPAIWNVLTGDIKEYSFRDTVYQPIYGTKMGWEYIYGDPDQWWLITDSVLTEVEDYDVIVGYDSTLFDVDDYSGSFHAVNNAGTAVGAFGSGYGDKLPAIANIADNEISYLYINRELIDGFPAEAGGDAYAINADGSVVLGFYFDAAWNTNACLWLNGGHSAADRVNLPAPTEEEFGGPIDYVAARWMSDDASVILGYAQDAVNGKWVMVYWTKNNDGTYAAHGEYARQYFTPYDFDENWQQFFVHPERPYNEFEPTAISANGEWVMLTIAPQYDLSDWDAAQPRLAGRLNLNTKVLQVLPVEDDNDAPIFYGVANNGTAVGAASPAGMPGPMAPQKKIVKAPNLGRMENSTRVGFVWPTVQHNIYSLRELFPNEEYFQYDPELGEAAISGISADATTIVGYTNQTDGVDSWVVSSFVAVLPELPAAVENTQLKADTKKVFENGHVVIIRNGERFSVTGMKL